GTGGQVRRSASGDMPLSPPSLALARIPDHSRVVCRALVLECSVSHLLHVVSGTKPEQELGLGVVEPGGMVRGSDGDGLQPTRLLQVAAKLAIVDRLVHAHIEKLLPRPGMAKREQNGAHQIIDVNETALHRCALWIEHDRNGSG